MKICSIDGCDGRSVGRGWCSKHLQRWRKHGDPTKLVNRPQPDVCKVDGCDNRPNARGLCSTHYTRFLKHGDVDTVEKSRPWKGMIQQEFPRWTGDEATYSAVHQRLIRYRGSAADHACVVCTAAARTWAYTHRAETELYRPDDQLPYSTNLDDYEPMCVGCHSAMDRAAKAVRQCAR